MMNEINMLEMADLDDKQREEAMGGLFAQLGTLSPEEQKQALSTLILQMAQKASDNQYGRLCSTNLKLASLMPDDQLKPFLGIRMQSAHDLGEPYASRDQEMVMDTLKKMPQAVQEKIARNL